MKKKTEEKEVLKESIISNEKQYIDELSDIAKTSGQVNFDLLQPEFKDKIVGKEQEIKDFINNNEITDDNRDNIVLDVIELWNQYKDLVKNGICVFTLNNLEIRTIDKKLHSSVDYDTESLFYGLHLKKYFLDALPKVSGSDFTLNDTTITFSHAIALYHVLSTIKVKGLNKDNYAFAHILYKLSEISKVYQYYDGISSHLNKLIGQWTMGLNTKQAKELDEQITAELQEENK